MLMLHAAALLHALVHFGAPGVGELGSFFRRGITHLFTEGGALFRRHPVPALALTLHAVPVTFTVAALAVFHPAHSVLHAGAVLTVLRAATFARMRRCDARKSETHRQRDACCYLALHDVFLSYRWLEIRRCCDEN
jgi:hypothetical protein